MARPTKLTEDMMKKAHEYKTTRALPTIEDFTLYLQVSRSTVYKWKDENNEFSDIVDEILTKQALELIDGGLRGRFNPTITKLILSGKHGYVEKSEVDQNVSGNVSFVNDVPRPKEDS